VALIAPENLYFGYEMRRKDRGKSWSPLQIFDDGEKTYLVFSEEMKHRDTPVIYGQSASGDLALVNFRVSMPYYIVDGLMDEIILKRGHKGKDEIKISRKDTIG
jgi:type IV secretion system protein VirB9